MLQRCLAALARTIFRSISKHVLGSRKPAPAILISKLQYCPHIVISRGSYRQKEPRCVEHTTRLLQISAEISDLDRNSPFKLLIELDRLSAPSELQLNDFVVESFDFRRGSFVRKVCPAARNFSYDFAILYDLKFGLALLRSKQIVSGLNLSVSDCRGFMYFP